MAFFYLIGFFEVANFIIKSAKKLYYKIKEVFFKYGEKWDELSPIEDEAVAFARKNINEAPIYRKPTDIEYILASSSMTLNDRFRINDSNDYDLKYVKYIEEKYCLKMIL